MKIPKIRVVGGFGSAGSSRSLRKTSTAVGTGFSTATVDALGEKVPEVRWDTPSKEDLLRAIETGQCCFCDSTKTYQMISQHWTRGHGIDLQDVRDTLGVVKTYPLITKELSAKYTARSKRNYPKIKKAFREGYRSESGRKRVFSKHGASVNRAKLAAIPDEQQLTNRKKANDAIAKKYRKSNTCAVCEKEFTYYNGKESRYDVMSKGKIRSQNKGAMKFTTCSTECDRERRSRFQSSRDLSYLRKGHKEYYANLQKAVPDAES